jgi:hypothetical protein
MIKILALLLFLVSSASAITKQELGILKAVSSKYFSDDGVHYYLQYMRGKPQEKLYEFTYMKWKTFPSRLTQADIRNGITKKVYVKLVCDTAYRIKENNKWSPWKQGGESMLIWFNGQIIYDKRGITYIPNTPSMFKYYTKPGSARGSIKRVKKNNPNDLPPGVTRLPKKK